MRLSSRSALVVLSIATISLGGCDACATPTSSTAPTPTSSQVEAPAPSADPVDLVPAAPPLEIGTREPATYPTDAALSANRRALAVHRTGDYAASEAAFREAAEADPSYALPRFNHACALARLGRTSEAVAIMSELLSLDLPTFLPRLQADEDLAALREGAAAEQLERLRARLIPEYERALEQGAAIVRVAGRSAEDSITEAYEHQMAQAGVWWAEQARFVPMGPALSQSRAGLGGPALVETLVDRERRVVIGLTGTGGQAEGGDYIHDVEVSAFRAITGEALLQERRPCERGQPYCSLPTFHALPDGIAISSLPESDWEHPLRRVLAGEGSFDETLLPSIRCDQEGCFARLIPESSERVLRGEEAFVQFAGETEERHYELDAAHRWHRYYRSRSTSESLAQGDDVIWLATAERVDFDWVPGFGATAISRITRGQDRALMVLGGRAIVAMQSAPDGSVYLQLGEHLERRGAGSAEAEVLPAGLALVATPHPGMDRSVYSSQ